MQKRATAVRTAKAVILAAVMVLLAGPPSAAKAAGRVTHAPFAEGSLRLAVFFGGATAFGEHYSILGAGAGYYIIDNLELGLDAETWQGNDPRVTRLSPQVMYVFPVGEKVRPYAGIFFRRTLIDQYKDLSDAGGRAGALFLSGRGSYVGAGVVYERHLGCDLVVYDSCSDSYLELMVAIIF